MEKTKIVVIYSGGMDSRVLLAKALSNDYEVIALSVNYGQRHLKELTYATEECLKLGIRHEILDLSESRRLLRGSSQTDSSAPVPLGHYAEESMKATVVPNRNAIMIMHAVGFAIAEKCHGVAYGAHAGDHTIYPDCRPEFIVAMGNLISVCDWWTIENPDFELWAPFMEKTKADIVKEGVELGVDFGMTWSCYQGLLHHCGQCGTCTERIEAFDIAGVKDPTTYQINGMSGSVYEHREQGNLPTPSYPAEAIGFEGQHDSPADTASLADRAL